MEIFKLFGTIFVDSAAAEKSISKTSEQAEGLGSKLKKGITTAGKWAAGIGAAAAAVGTAMVGAASKVAGTADEIDKASRRAGTSAENYQRLNYAMGQSGISSEKFEKSMVKNQQALNKAAEGTAAYADAYEKLGVSIYDANGNLREADSVYEKTLKKLADMEDLNQRNAIANQLFGKSYADLAPILDAGSAGIDALTSRAEQLGLVLGQDVVDAGVLFGDTMDDAKQMGGAFFNVIAAELLPILQVFLDFIIDHAPEIQATIKNTAEGVKTVIKNVKTFWEKHGELITEITSVVFEGIRIIVETAMELLRDAIDAVCSLIEGDWEGFWDGIVRIVKNIGSLLFSAGKGALNMLWDGMRSIWNSISSWVTDKVSWLADKLMFWRSANEEMSSGSSESADGYHAAGLPYVPYDGYIAELHKGETVLSAGSSKNMVEDIVNGLAPLMSGATATGPITINLVVDKKVLAQTIFDPLRDVSKQRGVALV